MNDLDRACAHFRALLEQQLARVEELEKGTGKVDYTSKKTVTIGVVDGDGIGPIITAETLRALKAVLADEIAAGSVVLKQINGLTIENRMAKGRAVPDDILAEIKTCDVLLKGPTTTPKGGTMGLSLIHISEPTRPTATSRMPSSA